MAISLHISGCCSLSSGFVESFHNSPPAKRHFAMAHSDPEFRRFPEPGKAVVGHPCDSVQFNNVCVDDTQITIVNAGYKPITKEPHIVQFH